MISQRGHTASGDTRRFISATGLPSSHSQFPAPSSLSLHRVIHDRLRPEDEMKIDTTVITVPGIGTPAVPDWNVEDQLEKVATGLNFPSRLHMYIYESNYEPDDSFSWESFLKSGSELAEDLARFSHEFPRRPIIFIAHSLGGLLLKKALILAHQNLQDPRFRLVVDCLSGILFLGTPHSGTTDRETLIRHNQILYNCAKTASQKQSSKLPDRDVFQLANLATSFQKIATVPILSVYECDEQRKSKVKFFSSRKKILVDEQFATISSHAEKLLGVHLSHNELCKISMLQDSTYSARDFLQTVFLDLAVSAKWNMNTDLASTPSPSTGLVSNPLNPLNLASIEPSKASTGAPAKKVVPFRGWAPATRSKSRSRQRERLISTNSDRLVETRQARLPCFHLAHHTPSDDFVGRKEAFALMDEYLLPRQLSASGNVRSTRSFALCGMGGIGKTTLAVEYSFSRRSKFGAVFWIEAGGVSQLATDFGRISTHLELETRDEAIDLESSKQIAKAWLNKHRKNGSLAQCPAENDSWLLIFDNADNLDIIADYIPYNGNGSILVTSRDPFAKTHFFSSGGGIDMEPLSKSEAANLLCMLVLPADTAPSSDERDASLEVANRMGGLPLAMLQMAGFIRRRHLLIREFADLYSNDSRYSEIHNVSNPIQEQRYGNTLATAFSFESFGADATLLLQVLAFLNPDRIREDIFCNATVSMEEGHGWTAPSFEKARFELLSSSMVKRNIHKKELWIHRVIQSEVRSRMDETYRYHVFMKAVHLLASLWPPGDHCSQVTERWAICENLLPHLERFYQLYTEYSDWEQMEVDPALPMLMNEAAVYLHERGFSHEGKAYLNLALALCERAHITQEPLLSDMHLTMGALANETNDVQTCLDHNVICLALRKAEAARVGTPDLRLAFAHSQMGIAYMMVKKFALATDYFNQSVELLNIINADVDDYGFPSCNLGLAYWVQGQLDAADKVLTDLLHQREIAFGRLDTVSYKTGRVLQALGNVKASKAMQLEEQNRHQEAKDLWAQSFTLHSDCLTQYESTLGKFAHRTADACHKLAEHHIRRGEHTLAQDFLDRALSIWGDREWYRNESARSSFLRGTHLMSLGGEEDARTGKKWLKRARVLRSEILPEETNKELTTADFDDLVCFWSI